MIKLKNRSIRQKIFIITSIFLFLSAFAIYLIVYIALPSYYYKYKEKTIKVEVKDLVDKVREINFEDSRDYIQRFAYSHNVVVILKDKYRDDTYIEKYNATYAFYPDSLKFPSEFPKTGVPSVDQDSKFYSFLGTIQFKDTNPLRIQVNSALQPIDEASKVILSLAPFILTIILGIAFVGSYIYTRYIADPIVKINKTAKKMTALDFETRCIVKSNDEIGEIANSLNELSRELKITMDELERKNRELKSDIEKEREIEAKRREFVATISHELKSPIAAAKGQIEGMINNIGVFKDREKYLRRSYITINSMEKLVKEMLDISKLENYNFEPVFEKVDLSNLVRKIIIQEEFLRISKKINLTEDIEDEVIVSIDEKLTIKAITNIINNALKYSPEEENLIISLRKINDKAILKVKNTGVHIDKSDIKEIFKAFYRVEKSRNRNTGGSGLGLYIVGNIFSVQNIKYDMNSENNSVEFTVSFHL